MFDLLLHNNTKIFYDEQNFTHTIQTYFLEYYYNIETKCKLNQCL